MSLSDITEKILSDAKREKEVIEEGVASKLQEIETRAKERKDVLTKRIEAETETLLTRAEAYNEGEAQREKKRRIDEAKRNALDNVFIQAYEELCALSDDAYTDLITPMLTGVSKDVTKDATVYALAEKVTATKKALSAAGLHNTVEEDKTLSGGFRIVGDTYEYDFSFTKIMEEKRKQLEVTVSETLFS